MTGVGVDNIPGSVKRRFFVGKFELKFTFVSEGGCLWHGYFLTGVEVAGAAVMAVAEASGGRMSIVCPSVDELS